MIDRSIPAGAVESLLRPLAISAATVMPPGMSGGRVYRCCCNGTTNEFALKCWPTGATTARLAKIHWLLMAARSAGCQFVPLPALGKRSTIVAGGTVWELTQWMPGSPLARSADASLIERGAAAITQFHAATAGLGSTRRIPPAITDRLRRLQELESVIPAVAQRARSQRAATPLDETLQQAADLVGRRWSTVRPWLTRLLRPYADRPTDLQYVLRDVHRQHVLFDSGQVTGLIDFDAVRIDTPAADLARWLGSFVNADRGWADLATAVADASRQSPSSHSGFPNEQMEMAGAIAAATPWISLGNWLVWLVQENREFPAGQPAVARRIGELVAALDY